MANDAKITGSCVFDITVIVHFEGGDNWVATSVESVNPPQHVFGFDVIDRDGGPDTGPAGPDTPDEQKAIDWVIQTVETGGSLSLARFVVQHLEAEQRKAILERRLP